MKAKLILIAAAGVLLGTLALAPPAEAGHLDWSFGVGFHVGGLHFRVGFSPPGYGGYPGPVLSHHQPAPLPGLRLQRRLLPAWRRLLPSRVLPAAGLPSRPRWLRSRLLRAQLLAVSRLWAELPAVPLPLVRLTTTGTAIGTATGRTVAATIGAIVTIVTTVTGTTVTAAEAGTIVVAATTTRQKQRSASELPGRPPASRSARQARSRPAPAGRPEDATAALAIQPNQPRYRPRRAPTGAPRPLHARRPGSCPAGCRRRPARSEDAYYSASKNPCSCIHSSLTNLLR